LHSSQHFVTVGLRFIEAFNQGDIDACVTMLDPQVEWYTSNRYLDSETHVGQEDVRLYLQSLHESLDNPRMEPEDGFQIGEHVMLVNRMRGQGTLAGNEVIQRFNWLVTVKGDKFRRVVTYPTPADARKALEEATAAQPGQSGPRY
jgi:ketosteroid isomerase-like protein